MALRLSVSLISNISYVHYDNAYDSDLYTFVFYPNIVSHYGITITVYKRFDAGLIHAVDVRGCVDIQAQGPSRHIRGRVVTMVYYITTICHGNYRIHIT